MTEEQSVEVIDLLQRIAASLERMSPSVLVRMIVDYGQPVIDGGLILSGGEIGP